MRDSNCRIMALGWWPSHVAESSLMPEVLAAAREAVRSIPNEETLVQVFSRLAKYTPIPREHVQPTLIAGEFVEQNAWREVRAYLLCRYRTDNKNEELIMRQSRAVASFLVHELQKSAHRQRVIDGFHRNKKEIKTMLTTMLELMQSNESTAPPRQTRVHRQPDIRKAQRTLISGYQILLEILAKVLVAFWTDANEKNRTRYIKESTRHIPLPLMPGAIAAARSLRINYFQANALYHLAQHFPDEDWRYWKNPDGWLLLTEAYAAALKIEEAELRKEALAYLNARPEDEWTRGMEMQLEDTRRIEDTSSRAMTLASLVPYVPDLLNTSLTLARSLSRDRAEVLAALVPHIQEAERGTVWSEALEACDQAPTIPTREQDTKLVISCLPWIPLGEALAKVKAITSEEMRAQALELLAPKVQENLLPEALAAARSIGDPQERLRALAAFGPHVPKAERSRLSLDALASARDASKPVEALAALVPYLWVPERLDAIKEALAAIKKNRWGYE